MKINISRKFIFEFNNLEHAIPGHEEDVPKSIVTQAVITVEVFDNPQEDCDGERVFWDYHLRGFECTQSGKRDGRQKSPSYVSFIHARQTYRFLINLLDSVTRETSPESFNSEGLRITKLKVWKALEEAIQRDQERIKELLS